MMRLTPESFRLEDTYEPLLEPALRCAVLESGALHGLRDLLAEHGLRGDVALVYDTNSYDATAGRRPKGREVVLPAQGLHADEAGIEALQQRLGAPDVLVAVGAGTVHDLVRYVAAKRGIPFVSAPSAASVDGFASSVAAMTLGGFKVTVPAVSPVLLVADLRVIAEAPARLTAAGVGDMVGKYTCLADWEVAHIVAGEPRAKSIAGMTRRALQSAVQTLPGLRAGAMDAYEKLTYALVLSGVAMQMVGSSRPASGAEHHVSHMLELALPWLGQSEALHGEKVGVGTALVGGVYRRLAALSPGQVARTEQATPSLPPDAELQAAFGPRAAQVKEENKNAAALPEGALAAHWEEVQTVLAALPGPAEMLTLLEAAGAKTTLRELGVPEGSAARLLYYAPFVRSRLTLLRLAHRLLPGPEALAEFMG